MDQYFNPDTIVSGIGCVSEYKGFSAFGRSCMIVCGKSSARLCGALDDAERALRASSVSYSVFDRVEPNPTLEICVRGGETARDFHADFILGIGGGSPLDAAKAIAVLATNPSMEPMDLFKNAYTNAPLPILAIPTTAGTGSEVTPASVITLHEIQNKKSFSDFAIIPKIAFLDPSYTYSLSGSVTASTAVDAFCHAAESYITKKSNFLSSSYATGALEILGPGLGKLAFGYLDKDLRADLLYGSTLAGLAIACTGTCAVHSMGYPLTYFLNVPHGEANAYFIADFLRYQGEADPGRLSNLLKKCGFASVDELSDILLRLFPFDIRLNDTQIEQFSEISSAAPNCQRSVRFVTPNVVREMFEKYHI